MTIFTTNIAFALSCKQSGSIPLSAAHEQTAHLSTQFTRIAHIEVLPEKITPEKQGFLVESVQVLICGELLPETPRAKTAGPPKTKTNTPVTSAAAAPVASSTAGQCQFDSDCSRPMHCSNNRCVMPNAP